MKVGDRLYCYNNCNEWAKRLFTIGRYYNVIEVKLSYFYIIYDNYHLPTFLYFEQVYSLDDDSIAKYYYYGDYFHTISDVRRLKLDKLGRSSLIDIWYEGR